MRNELMYRNNDGVTLKDLERVAPSIFAQHARSDKSARYAFIPTHGVVQALVKSGLRPVEVRVKRVLDPEDRGFAKHSLRFRLPTNTTTRQVGDVIPEIVLTNSHDGGSAYQLMLAFFRLACLNGLTVMTGQMGFLSVKHVGRDTADRVVAESRNLIEQFPSAQEDVALMQRVRLEPEEQRAFGRAALALRWDPNQRREAVAEKGRLYLSQRLTDSGQMDAPITVDEVLKARRFADEGASTWSTFNRVQENLVRGGQKGLGATGQRIKTRPIEGLDRDIKLNRALWVLASELAKVKSGAPSKLDTVEVA